MNINGFRYEYCSLFHRSFDKGDVGKWRHLVRDLPVLGGSYYPALAVILNQLAADTITIERARIMLGPHHPTQREGGITTTADLFDALNWMINDHISLRAPLVLWKEDEGLDEVAVYVLTTYHIGPDNEEADHLSRH